MSPEDITRMYQLIDELRHLVAKNDANLINRIYPEYIDNSLQAEYGSCANLGFANMKAHLYDADGNEIDIPKCNKCEKEMNSIIGKNAIGWFCHEHGYDSDKV